MILDLDQMTYSDQDPYNMDKITCLINSILRTGYDPKRPMLVRLRPFRRSHSPDLRMRHIPVWEILDGVLRHKALTFILEHFPDRLPVISVKEI